MKKRVRVAAIGTGAFVILTSQQELQLTIRLEKDEINDLITDLLKLRERKIRLVGTKG